MLSFHYYKNCNIWLKPVPTLHYSHSHTRPSLVLLQKVITSWCINLPYFHFFWRKQERVCISYCIWIYWNIMDSSSPPAPGHWGQGDSETHQKDSKLLAKGHKEVTTMPSESSYGPIYQERSDCPNEPVFMTRPWDWRRGGISFSLGITSYLHSTSKPLYVY